MMAVLPKPPFLLPVPLESMKVGRKQAPPPLMRPCGCCLSTMHLLILCLPNFAGRAPMAPNTPTRWASQLISTPQHPLNSAAAHAQMCRATQCGEWHERDGLHAESGATVTAQLGSAWRRAAALLAAERMPVCQAAGHHACAVSFAGWSA
jgi:hypothetical protein